MITTNKYNFIKICEDRDYDLNDVMDCVVDKNGDMWTIDEHHAKYPKIKINKDPIIIKNHDIGEGVGTELKKILSWLNIHADKTCSCNLKAKTMNDNGIDWCKKNKELILSWLQEEAIKRNMSFPKYIVSKILNIAIYKASKKLNT